MSYKINQSNFQVSVGGIIMMRNSRMNEPEELLEPLPGTVVNHCDDPLLPWQFLVCFFFSELCCNCGDNVDF